MLPRRNTRTVSFAQELRGRQTSTESLLWKKLRGRHFHGFKFRRQYPLGPWIADFACPEKKLVVEIDGGDHAMRKEKDRRRDEAMMRENFLILRFNNSQVKENMDWILEQILLALEADRPL